MDLNASILSDVKEGIGLSTELSPFDTDILMHINVALATLNQNGIGNPIFAIDGTTWGDFQNSSQTNGNLYFHMIPLFVTLSTKIIFDPPPPSSVEYHSKNIEQILWRLKLAYEEPYVAPTTEE